MEERIQKEEQQLKQNYSGSKQVIDQSLKASYDLNTQFKTMKNQVLNSEKKIKAQEFMNQSINTNCPLHKNYQFITCQQVKPITECQTVVQPCHFHNYQQQTYNAQQGQFLETQYQQELLNKINDLEALHYKEVLALRQQYEKQIGTLEIQIETSQKEFEQKFIDENSKILQQSDLNLKTRESELYKQLKEQYESKIQTITQSLTNENLTLKKNYDEQLEALKGGLEKSKQKNQKMKLAYDEIQKQCQSTKEESIKLECKQNELNRQVSILQEQISSEKLQNQDLHKQNLQLENKIEQIIQEYKANINQQEQEHESNMQDMGKKLEFGKNEYEILNEKYSELELQFKKESDLYLKEKQKSEIIISNLNEQTSQSKIKIEELQIQSESLEKQIQQFILQIKQLEEEKNVAEVLAKQSKEEYLKLQEQMIRDHHQFESEKQQLQESSKQEELISQQKHLEATNNLKIQFETVLEQCKKKRSEYKFQLQQLTQKFEDISNHNLSLQESKTQLQNLTEYLSNLKITMAKDEPPKTAEQKVLTKEKQVIYVQQPKEYVEKIIQQPMNYVREVVEISEKPQENLNTIIQKQVQLYQKPDIIKVIKEQPYQVEKYIQEQQPLQKSYVEVQCTPKKIIEKTYMSQQPMVIEKKIITETPVQQLSQTTQQVLMENQIVQTDNQKLQ